MACTLSSMRKENVHEAMDEFQGNASTIRLNKENNTATVRWTPPTKENPKPRVDTRQKAFEMIQQKMRHLDKWSTENFGRPFPDWVEIDGQDAEKFTLKFKHPKLLDRAYVVDLAKKGDPESRALMKKNPYYYGVQGTMPKEDTPKMAQLNNDGAKKLAKLDKIVRVFLKNNGIKLSAGRNFISDYEKRTGKKLTAVAYADIFNKVIEYSTGRIDGKSLLEESLHFVVWHLWESDAIMGIRTAKTDAGLRWLESSPEWNQYYKEYEVFYKNKQKRDDWETLVEQEITTKVLTNFIYDQYKNGKLTNYSSRWQSILGRFLNFFSKLFSKKNTDGSDQLNFPELVERSLGEIGKDFIDGTLRLDTESTNEPAEEDQPYLNLYDLDEIKTTAELGLRRAKRRRDKLLQKTKSLYNSQMVKRHKELMKKHNTRTIEEFQENLENVLFAQSTGPLSKSQEEFLHDSTKLKELFTRSAEDQAIAKELQDINAIVSLLNIHIKAKENQRAIEALLNGITYIDAEGEYRTKGSLIASANRLIKQIQDLRAQDISKRPQLYPTLIKAKDFVEEFEPFLLDLYAMSTNPNASAIFDDLAEDEAENLITRIKNTQNAIAGLKAEVNALWKEAGRHEIASMANLDVNGEPIFDLTPEELMNETMMDIWSITAYMGSRVNMGPWHIGSMIKTHAALTNRVHRNTIAKMYDLLNPIYRDRKSEDLYDHPIIKKQLKRKGLTRPEQLVMEFNKSTNKPSGYMLGPVDMGLWQKNRKAQGEVIYDSLEAFILKFYDKEIKIPRDDSEESRTFRRNLIYEDSLSLVGESTDTKKQNNIVKLYNKLWSKWYSDNTIEHPNIEEIKADRLRELGAIAYQQWFDENHHKVQQNDGTIKVYPAGELVVPNSKYNDEDFIELSTVPAFMEIYNKFVDLKDEADDKLPIYITSSFEFRRRLPQLSNTTADVFSRKSRLFRGENSLGEKLKEYKNVVLDKLTDPFISKSDDEIEARNVYDKTNLEPLRTPPIRYTDMLDNMDNLSLDVVRNIAAYYQMADSYNEITYALPYFEAIKEVAKNTTYKKGSGPLKLGKNAKKVLQDIQGDKTNSFKVIEAFFLNHLYGQDKNPVAFSLGNKTVNVTKTLNFIVSHIRNVWLKANMAAIGMGWISAIEELESEAMTGRTITHESLWFARKEYMKNLPNMLRDYESPIKKNKITRILQEMGVEDNVKGMFSNTDKLLWLNRIGKVADYGLWRMADHGIITETAISVMDNYRYINGKWYDRSKYLNENDDHTIEIWDKNKPNSFYNKVHNIDGKLVEGSYEDGEFKLSHTIKAAQWDFVTNRTKVTSGIIRSQKTDLDDSLLDHTQYGPLVSMMRGFIQIQTWKRYKPSHRNFITQKDETGTNNPFIDQLKDKNVTKAILQLFSNYDHDNLTPAEREGIVQMRSRLALIQITFLLMVLANANVDDDDPAWLQLLAYVATRAYQERMTYAGYQEAVATILRPVPGSSFVDDFGRIISLNDQKPFKTYKNKYEALAAYIVPGVKGWAETSPIPLPIGNSQQALVKKNKYMKNVILGPSLLSPGSWFIDEEGKKNKWTQDNWLFEMGEGFGDTVGDIITGEEE